MSRKRRRKKRKRAPATRPAAKARQAQQDEGAPPAAAQGAGAEDLAEVARLVARGNHKAAVKRAKIVHKQLRSKASERAVVDAYLARLGDMVARGMLVDAEALLDVVRGRYPAAGGRLDTVRLAIAAARGSFDDLVRPLGAGSLSRERRAELEGVLRRELRDPAELAACEALPADHPLIAGARAVSAALTAATAGPVSDEQVALPHVSRRGPLGPWKWLVRAIACFYRHDDEACRRCLRAIDAQSAPAALAPALEAMLGGEPPSQAARRVRALAEQVVGNAAALERSLGELDGAFRHRSRPRILRAARHAVEQCARARPELLDPLRQRIAVRAWLRDISAREVVRALGGRSVHDAAFWRLLARAAEVEGPPISACDFWEEFRKHAVHQGWFAADGPEAAAVFRRMLRLLDRSDPDEIDLLWRAIDRGSDRLDAYYEGQPASVLAAGATRLDAPRGYFLEPEELYRLICRCDPDPETFERWMQWAREIDGPQEADAVALRWADAFPESPKPYLCLTESCEKRNALKKALKFLSEAEARDALNPAVRRARLRLLAATTVRHLKQNKPHLARKDFAQLDALPQAQEGDRPAFVCALRCLNSLLEGDREAADRWRGETQRLLGVGADFLLDRLRDATRLKAAEPNFPPGPPPGVGAPVLAEATARVCVLAEDVGIPFALATPWAERMGDELASEACALDPTSLRSLAEAALRAPHERLAYRLAGIGLSRGGPGLARALLLRARSLPLWTGPRRMACLQAVAAMARMQRDIELLSDAMDVVRGRRRYVYSFLADVFDFEQAPLSAAEAHDVARREAEDVEYPASVWAAGDYEPPVPAPTFADPFGALDDDEVEVCNGPDGRRGPAEPIDDEPLDQPFLFDIEPYTVEDDPFADDLADDEEEVHPLDNLVLPNLPPAVLRLVLDELRRALAAGEEPDIRNILNNLPGLGRADRRRGRRR